jgi:GAF domain-containing protein
VDTPPDGTFDRIWSVAARIFDVQMAVVSIVDEDRIWFLAHPGLDVDQVNRDPGLCASAIQRDEVTVLADTALDPVAMTNPLVAGGFGLRLYVAAPIQTSDGHNLGTLCVLDGSHVRSPSSKRRSSRSWRRW